MVIRKHKKITSLFFSAICSVILATSATAFLPPPFYIASIWYKAIPDNLKLSWKVNFGGDSAPCTEQLIMRSGGEYLSRLSCGGIWITSLRNKNKQVIIYNNKYIENGANLPVALALFFPQSDPALKEWVADASVQLDYRGSGTDEFVPFFHLEWSSTEMEIDHKIKVPFFYSGPRTVSGMGEKITVRYDDWSKINPSPEKFAPMHGSIEQGNRKILFTGKRADFVIQKQMDPGEVSIQKQTASKHPVQSLDIPLSFPVEAMEFLKQHR